MENPDQKRFMGTSKLSLGFEHFANLSSEMSNLLANLVEEINRSARELQEVQGAVELKKKELEELRELERSAEGLRHQIRILQQQKEDLEKAVAEERRIRDDEKLMHSREEKEYQENLKTMRYKEEEEYRRAWSEEQVIARKNLEDELAAIRQKNLKELKGVEEDFHTREAALTKKEQECARIIREIEQFLNGLTRRVQARSGLASTQPEENSDKSRIMPGFNLSRHVGEAISSGNSGGEDSERLALEDGSVWDNV